MNNQFLGIAYSNLSENEVEIEFYNLIDLIESTYKKGDVDTATKYFIELEFNVNHIRSERKMFIMNQLEKKIFN